MHACKLKKIWHACLCKHLYLLVISFFCGIVTVTKTVREQVEQCIEEVRPQLQADGGDIELLEVENGVAKVKRKGACAGCPMSSMTLQWGVINCIKKRVPQIVKVEVVQ